MRKKVSRSFFIAKEVLFIGYSQKHEVFCKMAADAFKKAGSHVYFVNPKGKWNDEMIYQSIESVPTAPELAYVITKKEVTSTLLESIAKKGIKRILFNSYMSVDQPTLDRCKALGIETAVACPMMALGGGFHRLHGFFAGVGK